MDEKTRTELEAAAFRRLVEHLRERKDVQNIDLMTMEEIDFIADFERAFGYTPAQPLYVAISADSDDTRTHSQGVVAELTFGSWPKGTAIMEMLSAGGTRRHKELLAPFGLDASDPAFWNKGLAVIEGLIDELEALDTTQ